MKVVSWKYLQVSKLKRMDYKLDDSNTITELNIDGLLCIN